ncbi:Two-component sensor histidine kinase, contains HisKA and HATPase domains [Roseovarius lutimaris]|uniref:histidine kinase n=1 Tax=Roseovarius lutimaris TaxID=1005928 RepID=A0A1I5AKU3_9RHOB|nr:sensor histidine kinase [Roseovarius lutimaris]SFN63101.1 Two-component sensor histidine kinase, contains HisKA and HATPase domains [Roseovarius lutimaris]
MRKTLLTAVRDARSGLALRLIAILSIAILPLGLISSYQTSKVLEKNGALSEIALLDRTRQAAAEERALIQSAFGAVEAISAAASIFDSADIDCDAVLSRLITMEPKYIFAGFVDTRGIMTCASNKERANLSETPFFQDQFANPGGLVSVRPMDATTGGIALNVSVPVVVNDDLIGRFWISIPLTLANDLLGESSDTANLLIFDSEGEILATENFGDDRRTILPQDRSLQEIVRGQQRTFRTHNRRGDLRDFAVVSIVDDTVYVLGSWEPRNTGALTGPSERISLYFPVLMWIVGMAVAYIGTNRLVIRHIKRLRQWMRLYSVGQIDFSQARLQSAPEELEAVADAFRAMAQRLSEQERRREEDIEEKTTLLREVHHRVKNNLQLISSIMNILIRNTDSEEAKHLLRRVQDRVMALSAIHRYVYMSPKLSMVRADQLLEDIIRQLVVVGSADEPENKVSMSTRFDPVELSPDQSVPLMLLATEAAINAVKYCAAANGGKPWITLTLQDLGEDHVKLSVENSRSGLAEEQDSDTDHTGTGLGSRLIESFVSQLDGTLEINALPDRFELHVSFVLVKDEGDDAL